jgi:hypothetical protein
MNVESPEGPLQRPVGRAATDTIGGAEVTYAEGHKPTDAEIYEHRIRMLQYELTNSQNANAVSEAMCAAMVERIERLQWALTDAAASLETLSIHSGRDEYLDDFAQIRGYAANRATEARKVLKQPPNAALSGPHEESK